VAASYGAHAATRETLGELGRAVSEWGFATDGLAETISAFNARVAPPRQAVGVAPFYALEVRAAITFTQGGVRIDDGARALDDAARAIPGLLVAGADAGGVHAGGYGGGLATAGVFGLRAADTVLASLDAG